GGEMSREEYSENIKRLQREVDELRWNYKKQLHFKEGDLITIEYKEEVPIRQEPPRRTYCLNPGVWKGEVFSIGISDSGSFYVSLKNPSFNGVTIYAGISNNYPIIHLEQVKVII